MEGRGGCCIARSAAVYDSSKIDQIMLRYRPIAPKPSPSGEASKAVEIDTRSVRTGRGRRRRRNSNPKESSSSGSGEVNKKCRKRKAEKLSSTSEVQDNTVVTLPLLPETPDLTVSKIQKSSSPVMLSFDGGDKQWPRQNKVVGSWVNVERVTDTWVEDEPTMLDEEKRRLLEEDTCPGFITDCWNRVWWTNNAYKKMARGQGETETTSLAVWVVLKEKLPVNCDGFTCRVTVQSTWSHVSSTATVPCDVWRLSDGGFAWRLDVKTALSLGW